MYFSSHMLLLLLFQNLLKINIISKTKNNYLRLEYLILVIINFIII